MKQLAAAFVAWTAEKGPHTECHRPQSNAEGARNGPPSLGPSGATSVTVSHLVADTIS